MNIAVANGSARPLTTADTARTVSPRSAQSPQSGPIVPSVRSPFEAPVDLAQISHAPAGLADPRAAAPEPVSTLKTRAAVALTLLATGVSMASPAAAQAVVQMVQPVTQPSPLVDLLVQPLKEGASADAIERLQEGLAHFVPLEKSGVWDAETRVAVETFQRDHGLGVTGEVDGRTFATLWHRLFYEKNVMLDLNSQDAYEALPDNLRVQVDLASQRAMLLNADDGSVIKAYPISTGTSNHRTPRGRFRITQIRERPTWYPPQSEWARNSRVTPPGPRNPLGPAAMRLDQTAILFHGVPRSEFATIGRRPSSHGCIRMYPSDAWELHNIVKSGTPVEVR